MLLGIRELRMADGSVRFGAKPEPALESQSKLTAFETAASTVAYRTSEPVTGGVVMQDALT